MSSAGLYQQILSKFPARNLRMAFAYGSGVFEQLNNKPNSNSMIDFVFVVDDAVKFHDENLQMNASHYSMLKHLGPYYLSRIQNELGAACYYNTLVPLKLDDGKSCLIKYGVVSEDALIRDLFDWDYLYLSGRLQKPVKFIYRKQPSQTKVKIDASNSVQGGEESVSTLSSPNSYTFESFNKSLDLALRTNLQNAMHTSLLLLPERFSLEELFLCLASLSYTGDFRMIIGENKQKTFNIVRPQMSRFVELYKPHLIKESFEKRLLECNFTTGQVVQQKNQATIYHHLNQLPRNLMHTIINTKFRRTPHYDLEEYVYKLAYRGDYKEILGDAVKHIVKKSSWTQSIKSLWTAGMLKSVTYSMRKLSKMIKSL